MGYTKFYYYYYVLKQNNITNLKAIYNGGFKVFKEFNQGFILAHKNYSRNALYYRYQKFELDVFDIAKSFSCINKTW